jgi:hypothetical protein
MSVLSFGSGLQDIGGDSLDARLRQGESNRVLGLSVRKGEFPFLERDVIECDFADLNRSETQHISQVDRGVGSDIPGGREFEVGKKLLDLLWS